jgi:hypothetical protein
MGRIPATNETVIASAASSVQPVASPGPVVEGAVAVEGSTRLYPTSPAHPAGPPAGAGIVGEDDRALARMVGITSLIGAGLWFGLAVLLAVLVF